MTDPWMIGSALAIAGPAVGFIVGTLRSSRVIAGLIFENEQLDKRNRAQGRKIAEYVAADQKRRADARRRDERYRARQAAKRAGRYAKTHAELAGIVAEKVA